MSIDDLWYKNAVIYCLDVEKYMDANGDGVGDFEGRSAAAAVLRVHAAEARAQARRRWPQAVLSGSQLADLDSPEAFARAVAGATEDEVAKAVPPLADPGALADLVGRCAEAAGFERVYLHDVGPGAERFLEACARILYRRLRRRFPRPCARRRRRTSTPSPMSGIRAGSTVTSGTCRRRCIRTGRSSTSAAGCRRGSRRSPWPWRTRASSAS